MEWCEIVLQLKKKNEGRENITNGEHLEGKLLRVWCDFFRFGEKSKCAEDCVLLRRSPRKKKCTRGALPTI